jgi:hypothetical protein
MDRLTQQTRRYITLDLCLIGATLLISAAAMWLRLPTTVVFLVAGWLVIGLTLMIVLYTITKRKAQVDYQRLISQDVWAHWRYHEHEWKSITENAIITANMARQAAGWTPMLMRAARIYGFAVFVITFTVLLSYGLIALIAAFVTGVGIYLIFYRSAKRVEASLKTPYPLHDSETSDVYVGKNGIVFPGSFILFTQPRLNIENASIEGERPQRLRVAFVSDFSHKKVPFDLIVPIPLGYEAEASAIPLRIQNERAKPQTKQ